MWSDLNPEHLMIFSLSGFPGVMLLFLLARLMTRAKT